ncbi:unnamed protein product [Adineta ricciae]|uniref:G domain-containing protein n=1 Tax=Adineta ricciae TaxID=249248 RepID=A0A813SL07_ADIRI|nr:unnamed protein product [Adineta ricciae]CAF0957031.1 unnamed protein product [Adineta ricciae]
MSEEEATVKIRRTASVDSEAVLEVAAKNLRKSIRECEMQNPPFIADHAKSKLQEFTFVVCGAPRTGKSTLINAIINKDVAPTKSGPSAVTLETKCYTLEGPCSNDEDQEGRTFRINIWDTRGITAWDKSIADVIEEKHPMCMILCASPGSFANDEFVRPLISQCVNSKIFVALVCTNQWNDSGEKRAKVMEEFHNLLRVYNTKVSSDNDITFYGEIGLVTMVNSIAYSNRRTGLYRPRSGVNHLIYGIMKSLNEDQLLGWCYTLMENDGFWSQMQNQIQDFFAQKFTYGKSFLWSLSKAKTWFQHQ